MADPLPTPEFFTDSLLLELDPAPDCPKQFLPGLQAARDLVALKLPRWITLRDEAIRQQERELRAYEWREMEQALRAAEAERDALRKMVK